MDQSQEIVQLLTEIRDHLREGARRQSELLEFAKANAERAKATADRSVQLQEAAVKRAKSVTSIVVPLIVICLLAIGYLLFGLRWR